MAARSKYQVVNLGVQGYGTDQSLLRLRQLIDRFNARVVVYTYIHEHLQRNCNIDRRLFAPDATFLGTKPMFGLDPAGTPVLVHAPRLYRDYRNSWLVDLIKVKAGYPCGQFPKPDLAKLTLALVRAMQDTAKSHGAAFLVVHWRLDGDQRDLFEGRGFDLLDLKGKVPPGFNRMRIPGDNHPDPDAHRIVAELLLSWVNDST